MQMRAPTGKIKLITGNRGAGRVGGLPLQPVRAGGRSARVPKEINPFRGSRKEAGLVDTDPRGLPGRGLHRCSRALFSTV